MSDVRDAFRALRATPVVTLVAVLSLALGIGANTALFSIVDSLLLRSLPVERPERLALFVRDAASTYSSFTNPQWEHLRDNGLAPFKSTFAYSVTRFDLAQGGETQYADGLFVSSSFFGGVGVQALLGRTFTADDDRHGGGSAGAVAVIGYGFWQRRFGGAVDAIGKTLLIERVPFTIVGITPPGFFGVEVGRTFDVAIPIGAEPFIRGVESALDRRSAWWLRIMGRLKDDASMAAGERALRAVQPGLREATLPPNYTEANKARYLAAPLALLDATRGSSGLRTTYRTPMLTLMGVVGLVLLIACANIANLLLARAAARRHEFSLRLALGAPRLRLLRQLLVESLMLAGSGMLLGLVLARWGSALLVRQLTTQDHNVFVPLPFDWRVLGFTSLVAVATALLFGMVPALRAARAEPMDAIREHGRGGAGERRLGLGNLLVAGQVALSLVIVVAAGLFLGTFGKLATMDVGFDRKPVLLVDINAKRATATPKERGALYQRTIDAVRGVPGVSHAAVSLVTPVSGSIWATGIAIDGLPNQPGSERSSLLHMVTPDWFATYGTRILQGRGIAETDTAAAPRTVVVNEAFVRKFLKDGPVLGRRIGSVGGPNDPIKWAEVVGVAKDAVYVGLRESVPPTVYFALAQQDEVSSSVGLGVRAAQGAVPIGLTRAVAEAISRVDPSLALTFTPLATQVGDVMVQERLLAMLSAFFGALALLLAGLGLYGVTSYAVSRRRSEIGIRMALGATAADVIRMVLTRVGGLVTLGVIVGAALALWASRFVEALLFGLQPRDVTTFVVATAVLMTVGGLAGWLPARRAARIDPARVLRDE